MERTNTGKFRRLSRQELDRAFLELIAKLQESYQAGQDRVITPENVYQPARLAGREDLEALMDLVLLPGSRVEGLAHLDHCLSQLEAGRRVLFLSEHRGNFDVPSFYNLLRREHPRYGEILERLIYIAGRKLNESSDLVKMFSEKYSRLVIVPRRDFPEPNPGAGEAEAQARDAFRRYATGINRAAFRELVRLKKAGQIFVLFPLGGRLKPDADNRPVRETASYLRSCDTAYLIGMEGNTLPPLPRMEDERPIQDRVLFRVGPPVDCKAFLAAERQRFKSLPAVGTESQETDFEQVVVDRIMTMLGRLRTQGDYGEPLPA